MTTSPSKNLPASVRRLWLRLTAIWSAAWLSGMIVFAIAAVWLAGRHFQSQLDARLRMQAIAVYGVAYFDETGKFQSDLLKYEDELLEPGSSLWFVEPAQPPVFHLGEGNGRLPRERLARLAAEVVQTNKEALLSEPDSQGQPLRLAVRPTYEATSVTPRAAIIVAMNPDQVTRAAWRFGLATICVALVLGITGIGVGGLLARRSLQPLADFIAEREQFLAAAAHELRTPLAAIGAVVESAQAGNEPAATAVERLRPLVDRATSCTADLLLYARLEAGTQQPERQPLRLDLLAECCLPESTGIRFESEPVTLVGDATLLTTAIRNLLANAQRHAASPEGIRVRVSPHEVVIENDGAGFPDAVLRLSQSRFRAAPSQTGSGFGLAIVQMIAHLHGGRLSLENTPAGIARATITLSGEGPRAA